MRCGARSTSEAVCSKDFGHVARNEPHDFYPVINGPQTNAIVEIVELLRLFADEARQGKWPEAADLLAAYDAMAKGPRRS